MIQEGFEKPRVYRVKKNFSVNFGQAEDCTFSEGTMIQLYHDGVLVDGLPLPAAYNDMFEAFVKDTQKSRNVLERIEAVEYHN